MRRTGLPTVNQSVDQKYSSSGYKRYKALREYMGRGPAGEMQGACVWHDMLNNTTFPAGENWQTPPPDLPSGDQGRLPIYLPPSQAYQENYGKIDWEQ